LHRQLERLLTNMLKLKTKQKYKNCIPMKMDYNL
jgi:hemerythrin superfamily protein